MICTLRGEGENTLLNVLCLKKVRMGKGNTLVSYDLYALE